MDPFVRNALTRPSSARKIATGWGRTERGGVPRKGRHALLLVMVLNESLRGGVAPSRDQGLPDGQLVGVAKADDGGPPTPPRPLGRVEDTRLKADERCLLVRRQLDHPPILVRPEGREDLAADPKIGVVHVGIFRRFGKTERQASELVCGQVSLPTTFCAA